MENQYRIYQEQGVEILAVNVGEPKASVQRFVEQYGLTFPIPMDSGQDVLKLYGVIPLPTTFLIDEKGIVLDIITGEMTEEMIGEFMERIKPDND